jgi:hypothetical protein
MWIGLAAVPSGLLLAVTAHISTDVAAVPLFWVVPLALYLLAFIIAFQTRPLIPASFVIKVFPVCGLLLIIFVVINPLEWIVSVLTVHLVAFFFAALLCHGELARRRPPAVYLTNFYMWIATGGAIGGIATGLVAPHVFSWVTEYPLLIVLAILCMPRRSRTRMVGRASSRRRRHELMVRFRSRLAPDRARRLRSAVCEFQGLAGRGQE